MKTIAYITSDNGDGSTSVLFFQDVELAQELLELDIDDFRCCNAASYLTFPDVIDLDQCGFNFVDDEIRWMTEK